MLTPSLDEVGANATSSSCLHSASILLENRSVQTGRVLRAAEYQGITSIR